MFSIQLSKDTRYTLVQKLSKFTKRRHGKDKKMALYVFWIMYLILTQQFLFSVYHMACRTRCQKKIENLVKILLALIIFYKMNTDNDDWWFTQILILLSYLITKQVQNWKSLPSSQWWQLWTCFVIKPRRIYYVKSKFE